MEVVSGVAGTLIVSTGLFAGASRAAAILTRRPDHQIEWLTAAGFVAGLALGAIILGLDLFFG